jgi:ferredoxin
MDALSPMEMPERERLSSSTRLQSGSRLACQALLLGGEVAFEIVHDADEWQ